MDDPRKRSRKTQGKNYSNTSESETEEYEISLKNNKRIKSTINLFYKKKGIVKKKSKRKKAHFSEEIPPKSTKKENI